MTAMGRHRPLVALSLVALAAADLPAIRVAADETGVKSWKKLPAIERPVMFNTPLADAIVAALQVFPADSPWNADVSQWPRHPISDAIVASIGADKPLRY